MKQLSKAVFATIFILMLVACTASSSSPFGFSCQPPNVDMRCINS